MGVGLCRNGDIFRLTHVWWARFLTLALDYGWKPEGSKPHTGMMWHEAQRYADPEAKVQEWINEWNPKNYTSNDSQIITAKDAKALADALEAANDDIEHMDFRDLVDFLRGGSFEVR